MAIWTDGSAYENPGPGGYAALIVAPRQGPAALSTGGTLQDAIAGFHPFTTNIRMELTAIVAALR
ncbi:MAG: hypothetical protein NTZ05_03915, partial [Chloroflexi bacterium]|nr:hypothetical protein [Chloroflexota bacterium]